MYYRLPGCGDIDPNPGPSTETQDKSGNKCKLTEKRIVYSREDLLQLNTSNKHHLQPSHILDRRTWNTLYDLGIARRRKTHRGHKRLHSYHKFDSNIPVVISSRQLEERNTPPSRTPRYLVPIPPDQLQTDKQPLLASLFLANARSLRNKIDEVELTLNHSKVDVAAITETWLTNDTQDVADISGYKLYNKNRTGQRGGGVAIYVRDTLTVESLSNHNCEFECLWIKINLRKARSSINSMYVGVCYFPPNAPYSKDLLEHIQKTVDDIRSYDYSALIAILGDFNDLPTDTLTEDLLLAQMVQFPTRGRATLDKIFTNNSDLFNPPVCMAPLGSSDHVSILMTPIHQVPFKKKAITTRPYRDSSVRSFGQWITQQDWNRVLSAVRVDDIIDNFNQELTNAHRRLFPVTKSLLSVSDKPWMTHKIKRLIKLRDKSYKRKHLNSGQWLLLRNSVQREIVKAKERYYKQSVYDLKTSQPSQWHKYIKKICKLNSRGVQIPGAENDPKATAVSINTHFAAICSQLPPLDFMLLPTYLPAEKPPVIYHGQVHAALQKLKTSKSGHPNDLPVKLIKEFAIELTEPLTHIFNKCILDGIFPESWKTAAITPIQKKRL